MKILSISFEADADKNIAATHHTFELARAFGQQEDTQVYLVTAGKKRVEFQNVVHVAVGKYLVEGSLASKLWAVACRSLRLTVASVRMAYKSDAIYERNHPVCVAGFVAKMITGRPLIYELNSVNADEALGVHGVRSSIAGKFLKFFFKVQLKYANKLVVQTQELKHIIGSLYGIPKNKIFVVPNGAPEPLEQKKSLPKSGGLWVVYVGSIDQYHSLDKIIDIFARLPSSFELTVIGDGPLLPQLKKKAPNNVVFAGSVEHDEVQSLLAQHDVGICQYNLDAPLFRKYGFYFCPLKLLEYSAAGLITVIVGSSNSFIKKFEDVGVCTVLDTAALLEPELVKFSKTGLSKLPINNFCENSRKSRKSIDESQSLSEAAIRIAEEYSWKNIAKVTVKAINE